MLEPVLVLKLRGVRLKCPRSHKHIKTIKRIEPLILLEDMTLQLQETTVFPFLLLVGVFFPFFFP